MSNEFGERREVNRRKLRIMIKLKDLNENFFSFSPNWAPEVLAIAPKFVRNTLFWSNDYSDASTYL